MKNSFEKTYYSANTHWILSQLICDLTPWGPSKKWDYNKLKGLRHTPPFKTDMWLSKSGENHNMLELELNNSKAREF